MCVLSGIWTNSICIQPLMDYIYIGGALDCTGMLDSVTKLLIALRQGFSALALYYRNLSIGRTADRFFPYVRSWQAQNEDEIKFRYIGPLLDDSANKPIFLAETESGRRIVVKFVYQYHPEAHRHLASLGLAPTLYYFGPVATRPY